MSSHITTGRPTRSGELRASDDAVDRTEVAEEGYSANRSCDERWSSCGRTWLMRQRSWRRRVPTTRRT
jgi:hypothetical protein